MRTHWEGCWSAHHECALGEAARLRAENKRLNELICSAIDAGWDAGCEWASGNQTNERKHSVVKADWIKANEVDG